MRVSIAIPPIVSYVLVAISALIYGPVTCGFAYAMRNLSTERHVWFSELFSRAKENFKQGIVFGIVDIIVFVSFALYITMNLGAVEGVMQYFYSFMRVIAVIVAIFAQIGDLIASSIKRYVNTKDFGSILPGHGGVMDRIDSVLFVAPIVYYAVLLFESFLR